MSKASNTQPDAEIAKERMEEMVSRFEEVDETVNKITGLVVGESDRLVRESENRARPIPGESSAAVGEDDARLKEARDDLNDVRSMVDGFNENWTVPTEDDLERLAEAVTNAEELCEELDGEYPDDEDDQDDQD